LSLARISRERAGIPRLLDCRHRPLEAGESVERGLGALIGQTGVRRSLFNAVLAPSDYQLLLVEAPDVEPSELKQAVRWRVKDLIDFHIDDAILDVFDIPGQPVRGRGRMMYVVAARSSLLSQRIAVLEGLSLRLELIDIAELALRNVAALTSEDVSGVALLYLAPEYGLITVTRQSTLYLARTLDTGHTALAGFGDAGETLDTGGGALESVVLEIQRSLDYYDSHFSQAAVGKLYVIAPSDAGSIASALDSALGMTVRHLDLRELMECPDDLELERQARCMLAVGAALRHEQATL